MPPAVSTTIELSNQTCRLCLNNQDSLSPLAYALSLEEHQKIIVKLLEIDLEDNWPFNRACNNCIMKIRLVESIRAGFEEKNRIFDVLWTQYKRIHFPEVVPALGPGKSEPNEDTKSKAATATGYIIDGMVIEGNEIQIDDTTILVKSESSHENVYEQADGIVEEDDHIRYELTLGENVLDDAHELIEEDKEEVVLEHELEDGMIEEHILELEDDGDMQATMDDELDSQQHDATEVIEAPDACEEEAAKEVAEEEAEEEEVEDAPWQDEGYYDETIQRCYVCLETFETAEQVMEHIGDMHQHLLPFHCDKCLTYFETGEEMNQHLITHTFPFVCLYCPRKYSNEQMLLQHNKECRAYRCPHCTAEFEIMAHLNAHKKKHAAQLRSLNQCKTCGKTFTHACNLMRHVKSRNCESTENKKRSKSVRIKQEERLQSVKVLVDSRRNSIEHRLKNLLSCQVCSMKFESNCNLARHIEREHSDFNFPLFPCDICPKKFTVFEKCIRHRTLHRRSQLKPKTPKKDPSETTCKICNKEFRVDHLMLRHLAEVHSLSLELFQCDQCGRKFSTELKLRKHHYNSHRKNKTLYVCSHCGQKFEKKLTLKDHETKHLGAPAYRCDVCAKTFIHKHSLDRHALVHSDLKKFACDICNKMFKRNTTLVIHRRIHTGEKPYLCDPCGLRFIDSSTLIKHRQRMHVKSE